MLNPFFLQGSKGEQGLVQDLVNEQLRMYGIECHYIPRKLVTSSTIMKEVTESRFDQAFPLEAYLMNIDGYAGQGDILTKFGVRVTDEATFVISKERFEEAVAPFLEQDDDYQSKVIKPNLPALVVELSHPNSWYKILNKGDKVLGIESFGESAPANVLLEHFGFTTANVVELSKSLVND